MSVCERDVKKDIKYIQHIYFKYEHKYMYVWRIIEIDDYFSPPSLNRKEVFLSDKHRHHYPKERRSSSPYN